MLCPPNQFQKWLGAICPPLILPKKVIPSKRGSAVPLCPTNYLFINFFEDTKALHPDPQSYIYLVCLVLILGLANKENILLCWIKHFTASCPGSQDSLCYWPAASAHGSSCISLYSRSVVNGPNSVLTWIQGQSQWSCKGKNKIRIVPPLPSSFSREERQKINGSLLFPVFSICAKLFTFWDDQLRAVQIIVAMLMLPRNVYFAYVYAKTPVF